MHTPARLVRCNGVYGVPRASRLPSPSIIQPAGSGLPPAWTTPSTGVHRDRVQHDPYAEVITAPPLPLPQSVLQYQGIGDGARVSPTLNKGHCV